MTKTKRCFVYGLYSSKDGEIRYIGQTIISIKRRLSFHKIDSFGARKDTYKGKWLRKVLKDGYNVCVKLIDNNATWNKSEIYWIKLYKHLGYQLVNATDGGKGLYNPSKEVRDKIRVNTQAQWDDPIKREIRVRSIREAVKNREITEEDREQLRANGLRLWANPQYKERMLKIHSKGRTEEQKERIRKGRANADLSVFKSEEFKQKMKEITKDNIPSRAGQPVSQDEIMRRKKGFIETYHNKVANGKMHHNAKLTPADIIRIREMRIDGMLQREIAETFDVSRITITDICGGRTWTHV